MSGKWLVVVLATAGTVCAMPPVGLETWEQFGRLGELRTSVRTHQVSSYERFGGNKDSANFLETVGSENVLMDVKGPGCIYRIWMTGINPNAMIRIYFDGSATPAVEMTLGDFFSGLNAPFLRPLVGDDDYSSGAFICYLPMEFESGCRVTTESPTQFYNITYQKHADATGLTTFTGTEDDTLAREIWRQHGRDPKSDTGTLELAATKTLQPGESLTLAEIDGPASIQQIELTIPGMNATAVEPVWDNGRAYLGFSQFRVAIDPANVGVRLTRRLDYGVRDQKADVSVDGIPAGTWLTPGSVAGWLDDTFEIPDRLTTGKSEITVRVTFISSAFDWNEFYYWIDSIVAGEARRTDEIDVGDAEDEANHGYSVSGQTWEGARTLYYSDDDVATEVGKSTRNRVNFEVAIDPDNTGVVLTRRLDYTVADQRGNVFVDNQPVGAWNTPGMIDAFFHDDTFDIPSEFTADKSKITVVIFPNNVDSQWTEFRYWVDTKTADGLVRTDTMNIGDPTDEAAHNYEIVQPDAIGARTQPLYRKPDPVFADILRDSRIVATWDNADRPQVDVPLGGFFGSQFGAKKINGLPVGINVDRLYCFFPMPFADNARITLVNESDHAIKGLRYRVAYSHRSSSELDGAARFYAKYNEARPAIARRDFVILEETGAGHLVGVVLAMHGPSRGYLEGDERIYIDDSLTPALYGTGTEDFFNGGFYFNRGRFSLPTHGNPTMEGMPIATDMYRFLVGDIIPFAMSIRVGMQHGGDNDTTDTDISSIAFYYKRSEPLSVLTDEFDVGETNSEADHEYTHSGSVWRGSLVDKYEGDDDDIAVQDDGRRFGTESDAGSSFKVAIDPCNDGVLLRRRMNYFYPRQEAMVLVDGVEAGLWYDAGNNTTLRFRDSEFQIPASLTQGKSELSIEIRNASASARWTEYRYWVYTLLPKSESQRGDIAECPRVIAPPPDGDGEGDLSAEDSDADVANMNDNAGDGEESPDVPVILLPTCGQGVLPFVAFSMLLCTVVAGLSNAEIGKQKVERRKSKVMQSTVATPEGIAGG